MSEERDIPDAEAAARLARQLGVGQPPASDHDANDGAAADDVLGAGRLRLDKDGTLVGRPKLAPVRALRDQSVRDPKVGDEHAGGHDAGKDESATSKGVRVDLPGTPAEGAPRKAALPPKRAALRPDGFVPPGPDDEPIAAEAVEDAAPLRDEVEVEGGSFPFAEDAMPRFIGAFHIDRFPVTNRDFEQFVIETHHRAPVYWPEGVLPAQIADHPVVGVDYFDALAFAQWAGKDLPFEDEWERAARGTDGRTYPWGDESELSASNTARVGLKMTVPATLYHRNESPDGCRDMVGNVWELTHSPAAGGGVVVRGGSWYDFALYAKTYFRFATAPGARNGTIGFRCVRRHTQRPDEPREVDTAIVEAEIASRRGSHAPVDVSEFSAERRDLVLDFDRLRAHVTDVQAESMLGPIHAGTRTGHNPLIPTGLLRTSEPAPASDLSPAGEQDEDDRLAEAIQARIVTPPPPSTQVSVSAPDAPDAPDVPDVPREPVVPPPSPSQSPPSIPGRTEPAEGGRFHVTGNEPSTTASPFRFRQTAEQVEQAERSSAAVAQATPPQSKSMPKAMWAMLGVAFALLGASLVSMLSGDKPAVGPTIDDPSTAVVKDDDTLLPAKKTIWDRIPAFPSNGQGVFDGERPKILDNKDVHDAAELNAGTWVLFFLDPDTEVGRNSLPAIHRLHRRGVERGLTVAIVLDRIKFELDSGGLLEARAMQDRLRTYKYIVDGMTVVLDNDETLKARFGRPGKPLYATLVHAGQPESRTRPPRSSKGFQRDHLTPLVKRATELLPDLLGR